MDTPNVTVKNTRFLESQAYLSIVKFSMTLSDLARIIVIGVKRRLYGLRVGHLKAR